MGGGGNMSKIEQKIKVPLSKPPFILSELKKAIPPHCFQRSLVRSFSYVVRDITLVFVLGYIAANYIYVLPSPCNYLAWPIYWFSLGSVFTAIWVIAHECGHHGSFHAFLASEHLYTVPALFFRALDLFLCFWTCILLYTICIQPASSADFQQSWGNLQDLFRMYRG
ncbi:hypothetical protein AABB24_028058 [Solanum stoloniferum]|uniref:Fatty acid desaturase N-terminal domain-containing protein n=1 Tax=Solanum stoloniferum TaxID=62892 RepID=A0ABD2REQ8_9SOLN